MSNRTNIRNFVLLGFSGSQELQILYSIIFLIMYLFILVGNLMIIILVAFNSYLHTPMYFFLINLSIGDLGSTSVIIPISVVNNLMNSTWISYSGCGTQMFFYQFFLSTNLFLLTVMAYDRYIAICYPLHFATKMKWSNCIQMAGGAWLTGVVFASLNTGNIYSKPFCSNVINQFFCEFPQVNQIVCSSFNLSETWIIVFFSFLGVGCLLFIILTYVHIFTTVLRMHSVEGREKAFSTCIPHVIVVSLFVSSSLLAHLAHLVSTSKSLSKLDTAFTVLYTVVPSLINPIIYSMRNKDIKAALWKLLAMWTLTKNKTTLSKCISQPNIEIKHKK